MTTEKMDYKDRLIQFNSTDKYISEMIFMRSLLNPYSDELTLDYGCGIGTAVRFLNNTTLALVHGYDIVCMWEGSREDLYRSDIKGNYNKAYFMHSLAHIKDASEVIADLKNRGVKEIHVITPNSCWLDLQPIDPMYEADDTVVNHFTPAALHMLFAKYKITNEGQFGEVTGNQHERLFISVEL